MFIAWSNIENERLQIFDRMTSYPYGVNVGKLCKTELLNARYKQNYVTKENRAEHNPKWSYIPADHS